MVKLVVQNFTDFKGDWVLKQKYAASHDDNGSQQKH